MSVGYMWFKRRLFRFGNIGEQTSTIGDRSCMPVESSQAEVQQTLHLSRFLKCCVRDHAKVQSRNLISFASAVPSATVLKRPVASSDCNWGHRDTTRTCQCVFRHMVQDDVACQT